MFEINSRVRLIAAVVAVILLGVAGLKLYNFAYKKGKVEIRNEWVAADAAKAAAIEQDRIAKQLAADRIDREKQAEIDELKSKARTAEQRVKDEIAKNRVYSDCVVPADGVRSYNDAIRTSRHK